MIRLLYAPVLCVFLCAAQQRTDTASFEVADIKPSNPSKLEFRKARILPGGRLEVPNATLKELVIFAYGIQENAIMAVGSVAKWMDNDRFDVVAKAPADTSPQTLRPMLQSLLADRFKLAIRRADRPMSAYVLSRGKRELKLQPGSGGPQVCQWNRQDNAKEEGIGARGGPTQGRIRQRECHNMTMDELAKQLPGWGGIGIDRPVANETGLTGAYDFQLEVGMPGRAKGGGGQLVNVPDDGPTIFEAFEHVGLKLESHKTSVSVIVIDHAEQPTAN
jgi:uncharacterized protein (TIGR03435 family)